MPEHLPKRSDLGDMIRCLRKSHIQLHNGRPWTQEDLAVAIESDKAHINRIEKGKQRPNKETLDRIGDAFGLSWKQKRKLLACAGYLHSYPSPTQDEIDSTAHLLRPYIMNSDHPVALLDRELNIWDVNDIEAKVFFGFKNRDAFLEECRGLRLIEMMLSRSMSEWFKQSVVGYWTYMRRQVMRFMEIYLPRQHLPEYQNILSRILEVPELRKCWHELYEEDGYVDPILLLNHQIYEVDHPEFGHLSMQLWSVDITFDSRFMLSEIMPNDSRTADVFQVINRSIT